MPTSGIVLSMNQGTDLSAVLAALGSRQSITCGAFIGNRLPLVVETASKADDKLLWEWLWKLPGVVAVDVAFIYLGDVGDRDAAEVNPQHLPTEKTYAGNELTQGNQL